MEGGRGLVVPHAPLEAAAERHLPGLHRPRHDLEGEQVRLVQDGHLAGAGLGAAGGGDPLLGEVVVHHHVGPGHGQPQLLASHPVPDQCDHRGGLTTTDKLGSDR